MTNNDYSSDLDKIAEMLGYYERDGGWFQPQAPEYWNIENDLDVTNVMASLNSLLRRVEVEGRKDELEQHAAVTKGVLDPDKCMKLLAARHIKRLKELEAEL